MVKSQGKEEKTMDCLQMHAPEDEQLLALILANQPLPPAIHTHLAHCSRCQQRLSYYQTMHTHLFHMLYRTQCPTTLQLSFYCAQHTLSQDETEAITHHLHHCPHCTSEVSATRTLLNTFDPLTCLA